MNNVNSMFVMVVFILLGFGHKTYSQDFDDKVFKGEIIALDSPRIFSIRGIHGWSHNFCLLHLKVKLAKKDSIVAMVRVFNMHTEPRAYALRDGLKIGDTKTFRVFDFNQCECGLPRVDGYCENGIFYPMNNKLFKSYAHIYSVISYD